MNFKKLSAFKSLLTRRFKKILKSFCYKYFLLCFKNKKKQKKTTINSIVDQSKFGEYQEYYHMMKDNFIENFSSIKNILVKFCRLVNNLNFPNFSRNV